MREAHPMKTIGSICMLSLLLATPAFAADAPAKLPPLPGPHTPRQIEGWTVRVDDRLVAGDNAANGEKAVKLLTARLAVAILPSAVIAMLMKTNGNLSLVPGG